MEILKLVVSFHKLSNKILKYHQAVLASIKKLAEKKLFTFSYCICSKQPISSAKILVVVLKIFFIKQITIHLVAEKLLNYLYWLTTLKDLTSEPICLR